MDRLLVERGGRIRRRNAESLARVSTPVERLEAREGGDVVLATKVRDAERTLGRTDSLVTELDVVELVSDRVEEIRRERPFAEIALDVPEGPTIVESSDLLGVALDNAIVHTSSLSPMVEVTVRRDEYEGEPSVDVVVADDDPGIPPPEREVLVNGQETPLQHGSGIGLWLVNWIVSESMGAVSFGENDPTGSVVSLHLPLAESDAAAVDGRGT